MNHGPHKLALIGFCAALALALSPSMALAQSATLDARMKAVLASPTATAASITAAKKVTFFCDACHGADGSSTKPEVPNLAAQNPSYLLTQIDKFVHGQRRYEFMEGLMKMLTEEDRINVAVYYSSKIVKPAGTAGSDAGKTIFAARCAPCHGAQALGNENTPRLAGQQFKYLKLSIARYRDQTGERIYAPMSAMTSVLKDQNIDDLATYLSSLN